MRIYISTTTTVKKHRNGQYYTRRHFDGNDGVPKITFYLSMNGKWIEKLSQDCFFPTKKLASAYLELITICEKYYRKNRELQWQLDLQSGKDIKQVFQEHLEEIGCI